MRIKTLALGLLFTVFASANADVTSTNKVTLITLAADGGGSNVVSIHVDDQRLLAEYDENSNAFLFTEDAFFTINKKDKTYRVQSYADLQAGISRKAVEIAHSSETANAGSGVEFKLTEESRTIAGLRVRKLIVSANKGEIETEFWVTSELMPSRLREFGETLRSRLPKGYWTTMHGNPGLLEIIVLYGVPLEIASKGQKTYLAKVSSSSSAFSFDVPAGYKRLDN